MHSFLKKYCLLSLVVGIPILAMESNSNSRDKNQMKEPTVSILQSTISDRQKNKDFFAALDTYPKKAAALKLVIAQLLNSNSSSISRPKYPFTSTFAQQIINCCAPCIKRYMGGTNEFEAPGTNSSPVFSHNNKILGFGAYETIHLCFLEEEKRQILRILPCFVSQIAFSQDDKILAIAAYNGTIYLWDITNKQEIGNLTGHLNVVQSIAFSPDGNKLVSGSDDKTIRLWDMGKQKEIGKLVIGDTSDWRTKYEPENMVLSVAFNNDGKTVAGGTHRTGKVILWDISINEKMELAGHTDSIFSVAFSPDGKTLASASRDKKIILWDIDTKKIIGTLTGHSEEVDSVAFNSDGTILASASKDKTVILWDIAAKKQISTLTEDREPHSVAFNSLGSLTYATRYQDFNNGHIISDCKIVFCPIQQFTKLSEFLETLYKDVHDTKTFLLLNEIFKNFEQNSQPLTIAHPEAIAALKELPKWLQKPLQEKQMVRISLPKINTDNPNEPFCALFDKKPADLPNWQKVVQLDLKKLALSRHGEELDKTMGGVNSVIIKPFLATLHANTDRVKQFFLLRKIYEHYEQTKEPLDIRQPEAIELFTKLPSWLKELLENEAYVSN